MHDHHRERVRERYIKEGLDSFAPHQILELLLFYTIPRKDTNEIAHRLLDKFGCLSNIFETPVKELMKVEGVGETTAVFLSLVSDVRRKYEEDKRRNSTKITTGKDAGEYAKTLFYGRIYECFYVVLLNTQNKVIHAEKISEGTLDETPVYPRNVVRVALQNNAFSVILAHNHPGGSVTPSVVDIETTKAIKRALEAINIELRDHVIVCEDNFFSFSEMNLI